MRNKGIGHKNIWKGMCTATWRVCEKIAQNKATHNFGKIEIITLEKSSQKYLATSVFFQYVALKFTEWAKSGVNLNIRWWS
jgi:hypothetical protein